MAEASTSYEVRTDQVFLRIAFALVWVMMAAACYAFDEPLGAAILLGAPLIPFLIYAVLRGFAGDRGFGALLAVGIIVVLSSTFRYRGLNEKSIDFQVALRLVALLAAIGLSVFSFRAIASQLHLNGLGCWLAFYSFLVMSSTYAIAPAHAAVSTLSMIASFLFVCHLCVRYGPDRLVEIIVWSGLFMCAASLVVYVAVPGFGRMQDWVGNDLVLTNRLQGIFGTSNAAGFGSALLLFFTAVFYASQAQASRYITMPVMVAALLCLVLSNNRMALVSLAVSCLVYFLLNGNFGNRMLFLVSASVLLALPLLVFPDEIFGVLSRSGQADEITSGTGRTRIWAVVLELVPQAWFIGRGYASSQHILPFHPDLFLAAAHAHNFYLEVLFCGGVIGLALLLWCIQLTMTLAVRAGRAKELALFSLVLPYGLTEPIMAGPTYFALVVWQAGIALLFYHAKAVLPASSEPSVVPVNQS